MIVNYANYDVLQKVKNNAIKESSVVQVEMDVTYACNAHCSFCFEGEGHGNNRPVMSFEKICDVMDELKQNGCIYIGFSGGEPFMRKDFLDILSAAKRKGFIVTLVSNMQIPDDEQIDRLCEIGVDKVTVSFHAVTPDKYSYIFGVTEDNYIRALHNIERMLSKKQKLSIAVTVNSENFEDMHNLLDFFTNYGISQENINFNLLIQGRSNLKTERKVFEDYLVQHPELKNRILRKNEKSFLCSAGRTSCSIGPYGDVHPCTFYNASAGNLYDESFTDIWKQSHLFMWLRSVKEKDFEKCITCNNKEWCNICMAENYNGTKQFNIPSEQYCRYRKAISESLIVDDRGKQNES